MILARLLGLLLRVLFYPFTLLRWRRAVRPGSFLTLEIDGAVADIHRPPALLDRFRKRPISLHAISEIVGVATGDPRVRGLVVTIRSFPRGMATAAALRELLARVRSAGREVVVHFPVGADTKGVFVATGATRVLAGPQTSLAPVGFATSTRYFRAALDKAGLVPEVYARGRYKSAGEQIMRTSMSEPQREQLEALLDQSYEELCERLAEGRKVDIERARAMIDGAPYHADEAVAAGLVDGIAYEDELKSKIDPGGERARTVSAGAYLARKRALTLPAILPQPVIGVIRVHGAIARSGFLAAQLGMATDDALIAEVRSARRNPRVRAVILHINSPGGSALASDRMHRELALLAAEKPLIAYMADVAASGGYYVAAPAHVIVAQPSTITGSIGVVAARVAVEPVLERLGIVTEVLKRGRHADLLAVARPFDEEEKAVLNRELEATYRAFVRVVAEGRKQSVESIEKVAEGRVWTGRDAQRVGLVDELGGFDAALAAARSRLGKGADRLRPAVLATPRNPVPPVEPPAKKAAEVIAGVVDLAMATGIDLRVSLPVLSGERVLAWCPEAESIL